MAIGNHTVWIIVDLEAEPPQALTYEKDPRRTLEFIDAHHAVRYAKIADLPAARFRIVKVPN